MPTDHKSPNSTEGFLFSEESSKKFSLPETLITKGTCFVQAITKLVLTLIALLFVAGVVFATSVWIWSTFQ